MAYYYKHMNEYYLDIKEMAKDFEELLPSTEDFIKEMMVHDQFDINNFPTHKMKNPDGTESLYYGSSRHYLKVDPFISDKHNLHYAPNHRVYLILKNKHTKEWEFPSQVLQEKQNIQMGKDDLFEKISNKKWEIDHFAPIPLMTTKRDFTPDEKELLRYNHLFGVRTFYFMAFHKAGFPIINKENYEDYAWVPKRELSQFFPRDTFDEFKSVLFDT